jgi:hypothetical protein
MLTCEDFKDKIIQNIKKQQNKLKNQNNVFRIGVSGDFTSVKYIYNWITIINANPAVNFYAYTHSWTDDNLFPHLETLAKQSNMTLLLSAQVSLV